MTYSSSLAMGRQRYAKRGQNAVAYKQERKSIGPVSNTIILIILGCVLGLLYLSQVTKTNAFGYQIDELRSEKQSLQTEHDELEVAAGRLQSIERAAKSDSNKNLVSVTPSGVIQQ